MESLARDVQLAVRVSLRQPGTTAALALTFALGIGATTAVFSAVQAVLLRPLPYPEPDRLVMVWEKRPTEGVLTNVVSPADFLDWQRDNTAFSVMAAYRRASVDLAGQGDPVRLPAARVSTTFFDVLGVHPLHGRAFSAGDDEPGRPPVAVLGHGVWQQHFGGEPSAVGRRMLLDGVSHEIIGVLPPGFEFRRVAAGVWTPLVLGGADPPPRSSHYLEVCARLAPEVSLEQARERMDSLGAQLAATYPANEGHGAHVVSLHEQIARPVRGTLLLLLAAVAFVLLVACANAASLLLTRATGRRREMAVRMAIGASRWRLIRQALVESLLLAGLGGTLAVLVAHWGVAALAARTPPMVARTGLTHSGVDGTTLLFAAASCLLAGVLAGVIPAVIASAEAPVGALRGAGRGGAGPRQHIRLALVAGQVAMTVLLLVGAGLALRSFVSVLDEPAGFDLERRLTVSVALPSIRYPDAGALRRAGRALDARLAGIPGVLEAGAIDSLPLTGSDSRRGIDVEGLDTLPGDPPTRAHPRRVTPGYFRAAGLTVRSGRAFRPSDDAQAAPVVVVNETMARRYWPNRSALGGRVRLGDEVWREVVGIVADVKHWGLDREVNPEMYLPHAQQPSPYLSFVVWTEGDPRGVVAAVRRQVAEVDPALPVAEVRTLEEVVAHSVGARRWTMVLLLGFAAIALALAAAGIYGVTAHLVSQRTAEIGIRMSLGATPGDVMRRILAEGLVHAGAGLAAGLALALAATSALRGLLFGVEPSDPLTLGAVSALVLGVAVIACAAPARRAMRVDPATALRAE